MSLACNRCNVDIWINIHNGMCASCYYELHPDNLKIFAKYAIIAKEHIEKQNYVQRREEIVSSIHP